MPRLIACLIAALTAALLLPSPTGAQTGQRVALVVGNAKYQNTTPLANPPADARRIAAALSKIGFGRVELKLDLSFADMRRELTAFNSRSQGAEMALVFFAGHGMEFGGKTFLLPTDARLASDTDLEWEVVPLDLVLTAAEPSAFQLVILDACRDNPLAAKMVIGRGAARSTAAGAPGVDPRLPSLSVGTGLAVVEPRNSNTLIAYAAKHGSFALDGDGENSPYTLAILEHIEEPGLDVRLMFGRVRDTVFTRTAGRQEPFVYGTVGGRQLYLVPPRAQVAAVPPASAQERQMWEAIQSKNSKELLDLYLQLYPNGQYAGQARQRLAALASPKGQPPSPKGGPAEQPTFSGEITIAAAGPMTGANAAFGLQLRQGAERAVADINAAGGVLGRRLRLILADDRSDPRDGVAAARSLAAQKVAFVVGHFNSGISIPASEVYEQEGIIMISPASSNPRLTQMGRRNVFRVVGRDDQQAVYAGQYLARNFGDKRIAIAHDKTMFGKLLADEFRSTINRLGKKEVAYEAFDAGQKDFRDLVDRLKRAGAEVLYLGGLHTEAALIIRQLRAERMSTLVVSGDGLVTSEFWAIAGPAGEGTLMTFTPDPRRPLEASAVVKRFRDSRIEPEGYTLNAYAAVQAWAEAAQKAGTTTAAEVSRTLVSNRFTTVLGTLGFDHQGDMTLPGFAMYRWSKGNYAELTF